MPSKPESICEKRIRCHGKGFHGIKRLKLCQVLRSKSKSSCYCTFVIIPIKLSVSENMRPALSKTFLDFGFFFHVNEKYIPPSRQRFRKSLRHAGEIAALVNKVLIDVAGIFAGKPKILNAF